MPTDDGTAYLLDGVKLWTTNGVVAELLVVMARVPEHAGGRGGITAFVVEGTAPGITVERRNAFMGLRGIENGLTRLHQVRVPVENRLGKEGEGLKIALTTLNAGRLSIPAMSSAGAKWSLKIAREWSAERVQWGRPVGQHEAVAGKIAFIAATAFAMESVVDLTCAMADAGDVDIRIEAALAKLWASEMGWLIADELVQIRGGRGFETAESLAARGERAVPAEQQLRDVRINRIFEGSSEIMHLLIAREAVDEHLKAAGDLASADADLQAKARAAAGASGFYAKWLPQLVTGAGSVPTSYGEFGPLARHLRFVERSSRRLARQTFYGMSRWQAKMEHHQRFLGGSSTSARSCSRWRPRACGPRCSWPTTRSGGGRRSGSPTRSAGRPGCGSRCSSTSCGPTPTTPTASWRPPCSRATSPGSRRACSTRARAPGRGSRRWEPGPSTQESVWRAVR